LRPTLWLNCPNVWCLWHVLQAFPVGLPLWQFLYACIWSTVLICASSFHYFRWTLYNNSPRLSYSVWILQFITFSRIMNSVAKLAVLRTTPCRPSSLLRRYISHHIRRPWGWGSRSVTGFGIRDVELSSFTTIELVSVVLWFMDLLLEDLSRTYVHITTN
jgi:hypothetical protein